MFTGLMHTHVLVVVLFMLSLLIKTILLLLNRYNALEKFRKKTKVPEMIIDTLMLVTGIMLALQSGMVQVGNWFWIKLVAVLVALPLSIMAFRRNSKVLAVLGLVLVIYSYGVSETKSATMNKEATLISKETATLDENLPMVELGEAVYLQNCQVCHGINGEKGGSGSPMLTESELTPQEMEARIHNGKNAMPAYDGLLSDKKIEAVAAYVQTLHQTN